MAELAGVMVSNYFLLECLDREGMVETYRARPTTAGGYDVKLRLFRPPFPDPTAFREHFAAEVEKVWRCRHAHIQPLIEFGAGDELLYSATLFSEEETLEQFLESRQEDAPLPVDLALDVVTQVCAALQYAHEHGIVHGNIQPSSILMREREQILLTDFGMRQAHGVNEPVAARINEGNPAYIAPEQVLGTLRPASDIYSLGVLLYRLLGGMLPYDADDPGELALQHANEPIPRLRQLRPEIPEELELVVRVALAKSPAARFPSVAAFAKALVEAVTPSRPERSANWPKRRIHVQSRRTTFSWTRAISLFTLAVLLLGLGSSFFFVFSIPERIFDLGSQLASFAWSFGGGEGRPGGGPVTTRFPGRDRTLQGTTPASRHGHSPQATPTWAISQTPVIGIGGTPTPSPGTCASGGLLIDGSPALQPLIQQVDNDYQALCPATKISAQADESRTALDLVQQNQINIAASDLTALPTRNLSDHPFMALTYALIISQDVHVSNLSTAQIQGIYQGQVTNWSQIGGPNEAISVVLRSPASAIAANFQAFVLNGQPEQVHGIQPAKDQDALVVQAVNQTAGAISYVSLVAAQETNVQVVAINGASPGVRTVQQGTYPFWSVEHLYTQGNGTTLAQSYLLFFESAQEIGTMPQFGVMPLAMLPQSIVTSHLPGPEA